MGIYLKGDVYWFIKQHKGRRIEQSLYTKIKREAEKRYAGILPTITDGSYFAAPKQVPTLHEVMERYMNQVSPLQKGHSRNEAICKYWCDFFGVNLSMSDVTKSLLSSYKAKRLTGEIIHQNRKASESTVKKELSFLRQVFSHAANEWEDEWSGYFKTFVNPIKKVIKGLKDNERTRYITQKEANNLARYMPEWLFNIVIIAAETGYRRGKLAKLLKSQVDLDSGWINASQNSAREKNVRPVKMTSVLKQHLKNILRKTNVDSEYLFSDENGKVYSPNRISIAFGRACKAAGIKDLRLHDLRHDFATRLINAGASLYQVQHQLAHSDPRQTQRYAHLDPGNQSVVDKIDGTGTTTILLQSKERELQHVP
ncbi:MAG: site-specific integrase [Nitrospirota bacterium]